MSAIYIDASPALADLYERVGKRIVPDLKIHMGEPDPARLVELINGHQGVLNGHTTMPVEVLSQCPGLKHIVFLGTGVSTYVDVNDAAQLGIGVHGIAGYGSRTIAEHTIALMFAAVRKVALQDRSIREGSWVCHGGMELLGRTLGVVGAGNVGREVIALGAALGMEVLVYARRALDTSLPCRQGTLHELLQRADVISLHVAHTPETEKLINETTVGQMKPGVVILNTARGALIDEQALVQALRCGRIAHAALDVFTTEPLAAGHPLLELDNVTLTAHSAWNSPQAAQRLLVLALQKLRGLLDEQGRP